MSAEWACVGARGLVTDLAGFLGALQGHARTSGAVVQAMRADCIVGRAHVEAAVEHALRATREGRAATSDLGLEVLRYASGERQIHKALERLGVREGDEAVVLVAVGEGASSVLDKAVASLAMKRDDAVLDGNLEANLRRLGVPEPAIEVTPKAKRPLLAIERVALVDVAK